MANILIIDDDEMLCEMLQRHIIYSGHEAAYELTLDSGIKTAASKSFDVVFLDVNLPDGNGLNLLPAIRKTTSAPEVIIITGQGDPDGAELAIKNGVWDYIEKPFSIERVTLSLIRSLEYRKEKTAQKQPVLLKKEGIVGTSPQLEECLSMVAQIASNDANVLITGETGTGKELFAKIIHQNSARSRNKFVVVDCTSLPETLVESILFGHEKGAFTGADKPYSGLIREADSGTLFLDEIGELSLTVQKAFLRILQERRWRPLGSTKEVESNFRVIAATNRHLEQMLREQQFRQDLFFRINVLTLELPPLRNRPQDIKDLVIYYLMKFCEQYSIGTKGFSPDFMEALLMYDWPGNVRELMHTIEKVLTVARFEPTLYERHLPNQIRAIAIRASVGKDKKKMVKPTDNSPQPEIFPTLQDARDSAINNIEKQYLHELMTITHGDIKESCRLSGLSRSRLYHFLQKYGINRS